MGSILQRSWSSLTFLVLSLQLLASLDYCFGHTNKAHDQWLDAEATWYGPPTGAGSTDGACGYTDSVEQAPFHKLIAAGGDAFFKSGKGCGACYEVKCNSHPECSKRPVNIVITDKCPECSNEHFDLSGHAFGAMARPGKEDLLRSAGKLQVQYRRHPCKFSGTPVTFHVDAGSNPYYLAVLLKFVEGDGTICSVELKAANSDQWVQMKPSWGALWEHSCSSPLCGPISFRVTSQETKRVITFNDVLPKDWRPGQDYHATHY